jgi:hypothetical protein
VIKTALDDGTSLSDDNVNGIFQLLSAARDRLSRFAQSSWAERYPLLVPRGEATQSQVRSDERITAGSSFFSTSSPQPLSQLSSIGAPQNPTESSQPSPLLLSELPQSGSPSMGSLLFETQAHSQLSAITEMSAGPSRQQVTHAVTRATTRSGVVRLAIKLIESFYSHLFPYAPF